jgi:hypothetical protein
VTYLKTAQEIGELVEAKNAAYGSSFAKCGDFLRLLWPDGVPADRYDDALLMVRVFDKQMRIATNKDAFGESPYRDIAGYGILGANLHHEKKETRPPCPGSASGPDAASPSEDPLHGSAERPTNARTTTSANAPLERAPSPPPAPSSSRSSAAPASTAQATADASAAGRRSEPSGIFQMVLTGWLRRNAATRCALCGEVLPCRGIEEVPFYQAGTIHLIKVCSGSHRKAICALRREMR